MTSHVNFTALIQKGEEVGLRYAGLVPQYRFLLALGLLQETESMGKACHVKRAQVATVTETSYRIGVGHGRDLQSADSAQGGWATPVDGVERSRYHPLACVGRNHSLTTPVKVLGIFGSPRKGGNTELLLEEALRGAAQEGAQVERIHLADLHVLPCKECHGCDRPVSVLSKTTCSPSLQVDGGRYHLSASPIFFTASPRGPRLW
jgi:hypothetical protein